MSNLESDIAALGSSTDEIAASLLKAGARGRPGAPCYCPIASYLRLKGYFAPFVSCPIIHVNDGESSVRATNAIAGFIKAFDNGRFPDLEQQ